MVSSALNMTRHEQISCQIFADSSEIAQTVAKQISQLIRERAEVGQYCVLGLATGSTPTSVYRELVRLHRQERLSFQNVITFNLDEYYPMQPNELQSYHRFMREHLFDLIDIQPENVHIPDGTLAIEHVTDYCRGYEKQIEKAGGIDIQLLGIGRTGHIGFNEPGSEQSSRTRLITLDRVTRIDAASDFFGIENVPRRAITMGVGTILSARRVILMALGENKASVIKQTVEGPVTSSLPASFLQHHENVELLLDEAAADSLTRIQKPWSIGPVDWNPYSIRRAVISLAQTLDKPILKLTDEDYNEEGLQDLLAQRGPAYQLNLQVFRHLQATITGWPGGKPTSPTATPQMGVLDRGSDSQQVFPKRILVFSPHPDDDVISMGGTLMRLAEQEHEVHVAYQTSGNIAVFDQDAIRFVEFAVDFCDEFDTQTDRIQALKQHVDQYLKQKKPGLIDSDEIQRIKALIRRGEAQEGARVCGVHDEHLHFLNLPFYQTGRVVKRTIQAEDIQITVDLLRKVRPHQIYAAGDLSDPHGTHRTCLSVIFQACEQCQADDWYADCEVWLYRGAWQEWPAHQIEMAVPLSPQEVERKRCAIFKHESQKDRALFPGPDMREILAASGSSQRGYRAPV